MNHSTLFNLSVDTTSSFCMVVEDSSSVFNILILCGVSPVTVLSELCFYTTSVRSQLHSGHGKEHHRLTPSTSPSSILPNIPLQLSSQSTRMLIVITFASDKTLGWLTYVRGSWRGMWQWGEAFHVVIPAIHGTSFHGLSIVLNAFDKGSQRKDVHVKVLICSGLCASSP